MQNFLADIPFLKEYPLCVDLDGTLVRGHTLWQVKRYPGCIFKALFSKNWATFKQKIAERSIINIDNFQFNTALLDLLFQLKKMHVPLFLTTGAPEIIAKKVNLHTNLFDHVFASCGKINLVGGKKADLLVNHFGYRKFIYIGDSWKDMPVWKSSAQIVTVASRLSPLGRHLTRYMHRPVYHISEKE